ncbi:MAG: ASCH domain-containing protein [Thermoplasmata archaeon]
MIFTRENIERIRWGEKTETRRVWTRPPVRVGGEYVVRANRFSRARPGDPRILVTDLHQQRLGDMDLAHARREGCRSVADFVDLWTRIHGAWDSDKVVYVVRFAVVV